MQKRKSHNKSRAGCQSCKKRHVKCDEQGPPCANCVVRKTTSTCVYSDRAAALTSSTATPSPSSSNEVSNWRRSPIISLFQSNRRLELELMHRWTTRTFKSFCGVHEDEHYLQVDLPLCSLRYDFLLYGLMAISALDIAMHGTATSSTHYSAFTSADYARTAMEYYDQASASFRAQLGDITRDSVHCIYIFSLLTVAINLALPQCMRDEAQQPSLLERMPVILDLITTCISFYERYPEWFKSSSLAPSLLVAEAMLQEPPPGLDAVTESALARLAGIAEAGARGNVEDEAMAVHDAAKVESLRKSVSSLRFFYEEDAKGLIKGLAVAFPFSAGQDFSSAVKSLDPVSLLILMHWAVLIDRSEDWSWWVKSLGGDLVLEVSTFLSQSHPELLAIPEWRDGVGWARERVGLPVLG